jgi:hypothetical protein
MAKIIIKECGTTDPNKTEIDITTDDMGIYVDDKFYRFDIDKNGNLIIALINGVDAKITTTQYGGYPAVKLVHS